MYSPILNSGFGATAPSSIQWPTQQEWEKKFSTAVSDIAHGISLPPAMQTVAQTLVPTIQKITGKSLGALVSKGAADLVAETAKGLLSENAKTIAEVTKIAGGVAKVATQVIPIFAAAAAWGMDNMAQWRSAQMSRLQARTEERVATCRSSLIQPKATGSQGVTPADIFRPIVVSLQSGTRTVGYDIQWQEHIYPLTTASLFCALCGPESPLGWNQSMRTQYVPPDYATSDGVITGAGGATIREVIGHDRGVGGYNQFIQQQKQRKSSLGIPSNKRSKMARLIEAVMASARPRTLGVSTIVGDDGYILFPVLCQILLQEWRLGHWDQQMLRELQISQVRCYSVIDQQTGKLLSPVVDLSEGFMETLYAYKNSLGSEDMELSKQLLGTALSADMRIDSKPFSKHNLRISSAALKSGLAPTHKITLLTEEGGTPSSDETTGMPTWQKVALAGGVAGLGLYGHKKGWFN